MLSMSSPGADYSGAPLTEPPRNLDTFDDWLWNLEEEELQGLRLSQLRRAASGSHVELPQLTFLTVIAGEDAGFDALLHAAAGTARGSRITEWGGLIWSQLGGRDYVVSMWRSQVTGVHHVVASVPVTDSRWRRVEESWLRNAGPRLAPVILNKADFESVGDAL